MSLFKLIKYRVKDLWLHLSYVCKTAVLGSLNFVQDPNDPQKWIITSDNGEGLNSITQSTSSIIRQSDYDIAPSGSSVGPGGTLSSPFKQKTPKRTACNCPNCQNNANTKLYVTRLYRISGILKASQ